VHPEAAVACGLWGWAPGRRPGCATRAEAELAAQHGAQLHGGHWGGQVAASPAVQGGGQVGAVLAVLGERGDQPGGLLDSGLLVGQVLVRAGVDVGGCWAWGAWLVGAWSDSPPGSGHAGARAGRRRGDRWVVPAPGSGCDEAPIRAGRVGGWSRRPRRDR
jgi:hypothetical protein